MSVTNKLKKRVFDFDNYREYLKDLRQASAADSSQFSFRALSKAVGSKSPSFMKHVIDGQRNLTSKHLERLTRYLKFNDEDVFFFRNLVHLNQAKTVEEKQPYLKKILQSKAYQKVHRLSPSQYALFSHWYFVTIRDLVGLSGFKEDPEWISKQLTFPVSPQEITIAIEELLKLGLLKRDARGKLFQTDSIVASADSIISSALAKSHQDLLKHAGDSIDVVPREQREILGVSLAISQQSLIKVKEMVAAFRKEIVNFLSQEQNPDSIYQFHLALFPLARLEKESKSR